MKRIAALALTVVTFATASAQNITINETQMRKLQQAEFFIKNNYVDNLEDEKIVDAAIEGMLKQLDPHSTYIKAKDVEKTNENLNGLLREFYPKGRNLSRVSPATLKKNLALINARPKKVLGFLKPVDLFELFLSKCCT